jgi:dTDP-4-dehydrorhamnose reductase
MGTKTVMVLGGSGMLGAKVVDAFSRDAGVDVAATVREESLVSRWRSLYPSVSWTTLYAESSQEEEITSRLEGCSWVVNCIGVIKPYIRDQRASEVERAVRVNALFPYLLGRVAGRVGARVLQIASDCVYSGARGGAPVPSGSGLRSTKRLEEGGAYHPKLRGVRQPHRVVPVLLTLQANPRRFSPF